jgi:hypothetical protein
MDQLISDFARIGMIVLPWLVFLMGLVLLVALFRSFSPRCPACREIVRKHARKCPHCGESL